MNGADTHEASDRGHVLSRRLLLLGAGAVVATVTIGGVASMRGAQAEVTAQERQITTLEQKLREDQALSSSRITTETSESLGVDRERIAGDSTLVTDLFTTAFTWSSGEDYEAMRESLKETYGLREEDPFLHDFLQPSRFNEDDEGTRYYYLDTAGVNSSANGGSVQVRVVSNSGGTYRYAVTGEVAVSSDAITGGDTAKGGTTETRRMMLLVSVDADGGVHDLEGASAGGLTRRSA